MVEAKEARDDGARDTQSESGSQPSWSSSCGRAGVQRAPRPRRQRQARLHKLRRWPRRAGTKRPCVRRISRSGRQVRCARGLRAPLHGVRHAGGRRPAPWTEQRQRHPHAGAPNTSKPWACTPPRRQPAPRGEARSPVACVGPWTCTRPRPRFARLGSRYPRPRRRVSRRPLWSTRRRVVSPAQIRSGREPPSQRPRRRGWRGPKACHGPCCGRGWPDQGRTSARGGTGHQAPLLSVRKQRAQR